MRKVISTIILFLLVFFFNSHVIATDVSPLKVTFIDVGHGDCILIQTPDDGIKGNSKYEGKIILIDGGEQREGKRVIIPYLESHGIKEDKPIDFMIMTHCDADHVGGLIPVIEAYQIKAVLDPGYPGKSILYKKTFRNLAREEKNCNFYRPLIGTLIKKEGDSLNWGSEFEVKVLHSDKDADKPNNSSIVIWLRYGEVSFLLVGDAEGKARKDSPNVLKYAEKEMVNEYGPGLKSTFLKAGHHGSESSSTNAFIDAVSPQYVIICAGNREFNGTLLPVKSVIERYEKRGIKVYRTDRDDQEKDWNKTSGDDHIAITTDGTKKGTTIGYEDENNPRSKKVGNNNSAGKRKNKISEKEGKSISDLGVVYKGMPKEYLENAGFTKYLLLSSKKEGSKEWLTFSDWTTPDSGDTITFMIEEGKVRDWIREGKKKKIPGQDI